MRRLLAQSPSRFMDWQCLEEATALPRVGLLDGPGFRGKVVQDSARTPSSRRRCRLSGVISCWPVRNSLEPKTSNYASPLSKHLNHVSCAEPLSMKRLNVFLRSPALLLLASNLMFRELHRVCLLLVLHLRFLPVLLRTTSPKTVFLWGLLVGCEPSVCTACDGSISSAKQIWHLWCRSSLDGRIGVVALWKRNPTRRTQSW